MQTIKIDSGPVGMRLVGFWVDAEFRAGEYRLVPVGEAADKDARIAELEIKLKNSDTYGKAMADDNRGLRERLAALEKQLAERDNQLTLARGDVEIYRRRFSDRLPGVMPQIVKQIIGELRESVANLSLSPGRLASVCEELEAYYATPDGYEWQPVDDEHSITAEDVGRDLFYQPTKVSKYFGAGAYQSNGYILRPVAPPFVFDGTPGWYITDSGSRIEVARTGKSLVAEIDELNVLIVHPDGTFDGGRITGRVK